MTEEKMNCPRCVAMGSLDIGCPRCEGTGSVCQRCQGMGYLYNEEGRSLRQCPCGLVAGREANSSTMTLLSALNGRLLACSFDNFDTSGDETRFATAAYNAAYTWAKDPAGFLTIHSPTKGNGKTHLAAAAANKLVGEGRIVLFCKAIDLFDLLRSCYDRQDESVDTMMGKLRSVPVLFLDDLGTEKQTEWTQERMYAIIDHRLERGLPTMITTNCPLQELEGRIRSRITNRGGRVVLNEAMEYVVREEVPA